MGVVPSPFDDLKLNFYGFRYVNLKACITRLPEEGFGSNVTTWPARLQSPPDRLQSVKIDAYISRRELYKAEAKYWKEVIEGYVRALHWKEYKFRNVLDMRAGFGGYCFLLIFLLEIHITFYICMLTSLICLVMYRFAAALIENQLDCWVMNVVPVSESNTLPVIYDRGLIGVRHDWYVFASNLSVILVFFLHVHASSNY